MSVNFTYKFPERPEAPDVNAKILSESLNTISNAANADDVVVDENNNNPLVLTGVTQTSINNSIKNSHTLVGYEEYKKYIEAVYNYIKGNNEQYKEAIDRADKVSFDYAGLQKQLGRTDNQIKNDMVFQIFVSYYLLKSLEEGGVDPPPLFKKYIDEYKAVILTNLDGELLTSNDIISKGLLFFIPNSLPLNGWTKGDDIKILHAEKMNKASFGVFPLPATFLRWIIVFLEKIVSFVNEHIDKIDTIKHQRFFLIFRFLQFLIVKLKRLLSKGQKSKCLRLNRLLTTNETSLGYNYNVANGNVDSLNLESCDTKYPNTGPGRIRCKRLVEARIKLRDIFDSNCNFKNKTSTGGKTNMKRVTRKIRNKIKGGTLTYEEQQEAAEQYCYFMGTCIIIGAILLIIGGPITDPTLLATGSGLIWFGLLFGLLFQNERNDDRNCQVIWGKAVSSTIDTGISTIGTSISTIGKGVSTIGKGVYSVFGKKDDNKKMVFDNGDVYEGQWKDGLRHGKGTFRSANGGVYKGQWENDKIHGEGTFRSDRQVYEGQWKDGLMHGKGTFRFASGNMYNGDWKDGKQDGHGTIKDSTGKVLQKGTWNQGKFDEPSATWRETTIPGGKPRNKSSKRKSKKRKTKN